MRSLLVLLLLAAASAASATPHVPLVLRQDVVVSAFSTLAPGGSVTGWEELRLGDAPRSTYTLVRDGGQTVVRGEADRSASGLVRRMRIDPARTPVLTWRWKVDGVIPRGDVTRRDGDDYPARIYITFDVPLAQLSAGDRLRIRGARLLGYREIPTRAINYIWANRASETRPVPNPFTGLVTMIPVQSGPARAGTWQTETRNVVDDYRAAYGEDPPAITGIAIMTDADNTGGRAVGYFGDIRMRAR